MMDDRSLFEHKTVPQGPPKFVQPVACGACGSRDHENGDCFAAELRVKKMKEAEGTKQNMQQRWGRRPISVKV